MLGLGATWSRFHQPPPQQQQQHKAYAARRSDQSPSVTSHETSLLSMKQGLLQIPSKLKRQFKASSLKALAAASLPQPASLEAQSDVAGLYTQPKGENAKKEEEENFVDVPLLASPPLSVTTTLHSDATTHERTQSNGSGGSNRTEGRPTSGLSQYSTLTTLTDFSTAAGKSYPLRASSSFSSLSSLLYLEQFGGSSGSDDDEASHRRQQSMQSIELMMGQLDLQPLDARDEPDTADASALLEKQKEAEATRLLTESDYFVDGSEKEPFDKWEEAKRILILNENDHRVDGAAVRLAYPTAANVDWSMRRMLVIWMNEVALQLRLTECFYLGVNFLDRYVSASSRDRPVNLSTFQCLGAACLWIASKNSERYPPTAEDFCICGDRAFSRDDLIEWEMEILRVLNWGIHHVTPILILDGLVSAPQCPFALTETIRVNFNRWIEIAFYEAEMYVYPISILTFSALLLSIPHPLRSEVEDFIMEDIKWMLVRGWRADLRLPSADALEAWRQHCAPSSTCTFVLCRTSPAAAASAEKEKAHHHHCPHFSQDTKASASLRHHQKKELEAEKRPDHPLPSSSILLGSDENQALMALAQCITSLLVMEANVSKRRRA